MSKVTTTLTPSECRRLDEAVRELDWWDVFEWVGAPLDAVRRAARGEPILFTTADIIRRFLGGLPVAAE
jgi:hypothetical protein